MNILVISDQKSRPLWDFFEPSRLKDIDLILSCGDLPPQYLSFLATFTSAPVLYVHGNHDDCYETTPPEGCTCIDDRIYVFKGIRILGIPGAMRYSRDVIYQYNEKEMEKKVRKLWFTIRRHKGFDILLTHSPAFELGDDSDLPHTGYKCFRELLDKYEPKYMIHGHVHLNYGNQKRVRQYNNTMLINGFEQYRFEYETGMQIYKL